MNELSEMYCAYPTLVISRLTGLRQLMQAVNGAMAQERLQRVTLESAPDPLTRAVRITERRTNPDPSESAERRASEVGSSPGVPVGTATPESTAREIYLQFWFPTSPTEPESGNLFHITQASTTTTPVPYAHGSSSATSYQLCGSVSHGTYDSRMDSSINTPTIPLIISKVVNFKFQLLDAPSVAVWLTGMSGTTGAAVAIQVTAINITTTQFTLQIDSSAGDRLLSVGVAWAVWDSDEKLVVDSFDNIGLKISHSVWTLVHAALSGIKLVLQPEQFVILDATMMEYRFDETKMYNYGLRQSDERECSGTMITVMRRS